MDAIQPTKKPATKAELTAHWRSKAAEIRSSIQDTPDLEAATKGIVESAASMIESCASQLEALLTI